MLPVFLPRRAALPRMPVEPVMQRRFCFERVRLHLSFQPLQPPLPLFLPRRVCLQQTEHRRAALMTRISHEWESAGYREGRNSFCSVLPDELSVPPGSRPDT